jgi:hypothetical protein
MNAEPTTAETKPKTDRKTYMREYKRKQYEERKDYIKEINKKSYYQTKYNPNTEDYKKYADHYQAVCRIKRELEKVPLDVIICILADYNQQNEIRI